MKKTPSELISRAQKAEHYSPHAEGYSLNGSPLMTNSKVFFAHIGGLRAIAILLVILFHLNAEYFPCCFYGVDIFLVITGYLLFVSMQKKNCGLRDVPVFCCKKLQRIMPPVVVVLLSTVLCGYFVLDGQVLSDACRLGRYTLFCMSNIHLNKIAADYFASNIMESPFMHMWYIGVVMQVYLIFILGKVVYDRCMPGEKKKWLLNCKTKCDSK